MESTNQQGVLCIILGICSMFFVAGNEVRHLNQKAYPLGVSVDYEKTLEMKKNLREMKMHRDFVIPENKRDVDGLRFSPYYYDRLDETNYLT